MTNTGTYDRVNDPTYRINEIDEAKERIASRFRQKIDLVRVINKNKAELAMLELEDASDRYLIRELGRSPYSSLKTYFRDESRRPAGMTATQ